MLKRLKTAYSDLVDNACPLSEHPRPQLTRVDNLWQCLNGIWKYAIVKGTLPDVTHLKDVALPAWDGDILVPFSPETLLSGVKRTLTPLDVLWYERTFSADHLWPLFGGRILLHFGAVDQVCKVFINDRLAGENEGGYWSFTLDITEFIVPGDNKLTIAVSDPSETGDRAYGKQTTKRGKIWYSSTSGIWQTVWLEGVPERYIEEIKITPHMESETVRLDLKIHGGAAGLSGYGKITYCPEGIEADARAMVLDAGTITTVEANGDVLTLRGELDLLVPWSPEHPALYEYQLSVADDEIKGYFAMRSFGIGKNENNHPCLLLNGEPYNQVGVLDQGYWSDGYYTPPTDQAMVDDISAMKALGFNMLRKHIKIEPMRWYYHADRLGMLVWQDMVNGGGPYRFSVIGLLPFIGIKLNDTKRYARFGRKSVESRRLFESELVRTIEQLYSVPSICLWVPFNEGWGQFDAARIYTWIKSMDPTRPVDHASGWHDQGAGDLKSRHIYFRKIRLKEDKYDRPLALSEFGGYSYAVPGHTSSDTTYGYKPFKTIEAYQEGVIALFSHLVTEQKRLAASVYTQLSDVEDETNGLLTFDRKVSKWPLDREATERLRALILALRENTRLRGNPVCRYGITSRRNWKHFSHQVEQDIGSPDASHRTRIRNKNPPLLKRLMKRAHFMKER